MAAGRMPGLNLEDLWYRAEMEEIITLYFPLDMAKDQGYALLGLISYGPIACGRKDVLRAGRRIWWKLDRTAMEAELNESWEVYISCCNRDIVLLADTIDSLKNVMYRDRDFPADPRDLTRFMYYIRGIREEREEAKRRWVMNQVVQLFIS